MNIKSLPQLTDKDIARFWSKVAKGMLNSCWNWRVGKCGNGYGYFRVNGKKYYSHRLAYFLSRKKDPGSKFVCHVCDNPACCNPKHLWLGVASDNSQDMVKKHRQHQGEGIVQAKLTVKDVICIKRSTKSGEVLAKCFGVSIGLISMIQRGLIWKSVASHLNRSKCCLSASIVRAIRKSPLSRRLLAAKYGLHEETISRIRLHKTWKNIR